MATLLRIGLRALAALGLLAAVAVLAAALLLVALSGGWQRDRVTAWIASAIGASLGADVQIASLDGALYDGLVARGIVMTAPNRAPLTIDTLSLRFDPMPALRERRLAITALVVEGLDLEVEEQGEQWQLSGMTETFGGADDDDPEPPALRVVEIARLELRDAHVVLAMEDGATRLDARGELEAQALRWASDEAMQLPTSAASRITITDSVVADRAVERADLALRLAGASLQIERADLAGDFGRVAATGEAELANAALPPALARARADATLTALDLAAFAGDPELASRLDGTLHAEFAPDAVADPGAGLLQARLELRGPELGALGVDTLRLRGSLHTETLAFEIDEAFAAGAAGTFRAHGQGRGEKIDDAAIQAELRLEHLPARWLGDSKLSGRVDLKAEARGTLDDPLGRLDLVATELRQAGSEPARLEVHATAPGQRALRIDALAFESRGLAIRASEPARFRIEPGEAPALQIEALGLAFPGGEVHARGRVTSASLDGLRIDLDARDLAATVAAFGLDASVSGAIEGSITADGPLARPALRGTLVAAPIAFAEQAVERIEIAIAPDAQRTAVTARLLDGGAERLRVIARVSSDALWSAPGQLLERSDSEVRAEAEALEVAWIAGLIGREAGEFAGRVDLDAVARGARGRPLVTGTLRLADGRVKTGDLDEPLGPIEAALRLEADRLRVESIVIPGGAGAIRASGTLALGAAALGESDVQVDVDAFALPKGLPATGRLDGALHLGGTWPEVRLAGRIAVGGANVDLGIRRDPVWSEIRIHGLPGEQPSADAASREDEAGFPAALLPASADVAISIPPDTRVQGNGADLRIAGDVRILKHPGALPLYLGGIRVVEGRYQFQGRRFEIERGTVTLTGGREIDPEIDVVAVQKLREVTLRVVVSGRASAPDASLQSDPPMDPSDQLSYLAFGRPASSLGGNDAAQLQSAATQVIGQLAFADFGGELEGLIPLDSVQVQGDAEGIGIGGNIAPGIHLRYAHDIATNDDRVGIEWQFRPRWILRSEVKSDGNAGADVIWSFDY